MRILTNNDVIELFTSLNTEILFGKIKGYPEINIKENNDYEHLMSYPWIEKVGIQIFCLDKSTYIMRNGTNLRT